MSFWGGFGFQNLTFLKNSELESLHDLIMVWLMVIITLVLFISIMVVLNKNQGVTFLSLDSLVLEVTWTFIPIIILISIAIPSISLLCFQDSFNGKIFNSVKMISSQWSWQSDQNNELFDHLLDSDQMDKLSSFEYLLSVPFNKETRILVTSTDVLHSLGIPSMGVKLDSTPGRLNAVLINPLSLGIITGSCYELCGSGHSAMPVFFSSF